MRRGGGNVGVGERSRERWMRSKRQGEDIFGCIPRRGVDPSRFCPIYPFQCVKTGGKVAVHHLVRTAGDTG